MKVHRRWEPPEIPGLAFNRGEKPMVTGACISSPFNDGDWVTVVVPLESNGKEYREECHVLFRRCTFHDSWEFQISDTLLRQNIQGIHAVLGLALAELGKLVK
jgi:hypothetical protein